MQHKTFERSECPIAQGLERVGEWWSMLIMRDALQGYTRFDEFSRSLGIPPNTLTRRLGALVEAGLLERRAYCEKPLRYEYVPTEKGRDLKIVLAALVAWGNKHFAPEGPSIQVIARSTGEVLEPQMVSEATRQSVDLDACEFVAGPAASEGMRMRLKSLAERTES